MHLARESHMDEPNQRRLQDTGQLIGHVHEIVRDLLQQRLALAVRHPGIGGVGQPGRSVVSRAVGREEVVEARRGGIALGQRPQAIQVLNSREQRGVIVDGVVDHAALDVPRDDDGRYPNADSHLTATSVTPTSPATQR